MNVKLDDIDVEIVRALQRDARASFADIAVRCAVSIDTVSKRYKRMIKNGIARGATVLLNPKSFGYDCVASFGITVDFPHVGEVVDAVRKIPEVAFCAPSMGRHNVFAIAVLRNVGRLGQVKELIQGHPRVREASASIWVDEILLCPENFEFEEIKKKE